MKNATLLLLATIYAFPVLARSPAPENSEVYFIEPQNGAVFDSPVTVKFGLKDMGVAPAGVNVPNTGHHHLLVDTNLPDLNMPIPSDENHRHFGRGQTETSLELAPGVHTLQLLLGDSAHIPHDPPVKSEKITITIK